MSAMWSTDFFLALWGVAGIWLLQCLWMNEGNIVKSHKVLWEKLFETYFPVGTLLLLFVAGPLVWLGLCAYGAFIAVVLVGMRIGYALDESL